MGPKRILTEQEKVKRRKASREFRKQKKKTDPLWLKKEAARISKFYVPKSQCSKEKWEEYKRSKREGMTRQRAKKKEAALRAQVSMRRGRSTVRTPPEDFQKLPPRSRPNQLSPSPTVDQHYVNETPSTSQRNTIRLPAVANKCRALKRQLDKKEKENKDLQKNMGILRKRLEAAETHPEAPSTPIREAHQLLGDLQKNPTRSALKRVIPYTTTVNAVREAPLKTKRKLLSPSAPNKENKGVAGAFAHSLCSPRSIAKVTKTPVRYICRSYRPTKKLVSQSRKNLAVAFLKRPDNSGQLPSKKHHVKGQVKYGLTDTMENLYRKFKSEYSSVQISRSTFYAARPNNIKLVQWTNRNQCLCQVCANISLMINATKVLPKSGKSVSDMADEDIQVKLKQLPEQITFKQWRKVEVPFQGKKIKKTKRISVTMNRATFTTTFMKQMKNYKQHCKRVETQYQEIRRLKEKLSPMKEATVQMDYAENWKCGYQNEISAVFYDKNQVSIHPMVVHFRDNEDQLQHISFVGITGEGKHCAPTTYTFMKALIPKLKLQLPNLQTVHYITDSPSSQYRNRYVAAIVGRHNSQFGTNASWTYLETGHGKGPCDGVGGGIKKMADNSIKKGDTITNAKEFHQVMSQRESKLTLIYIETEEVQATRNEIASWKVVSCDGIASAHALLPAAGYIMIKEVSCFNDCCYKEGHFHLSCPGWQVTDIKVVEAKKASGATNPKVVETRRARDASNVKAVKMKEAGETSNVKAVGTKEAGETSNVKAVETKEAGETSNAKAVETKEAGETSNAKAVEMKEASEVEEIDSDDEMPLSLWSKKIMENDKVGLLDGCDGIWKMEYIADERFNKKKKYMEYLVKWHGWENKTWEPEENILDKNVIEVFRASRSQEQ